MIRGELAETLRGEGSANRIVRERAKGIVDETWENWRSRSEDLGVPLLAYVCNVIAGSPRYGAGETAAVFCHGYDRAGDEWGEAGDKIADYLRERVESKPNMLWSLLFSAAGPPVEAYVDLLDKYDEGLPRMLAVDSFEQQLPVRIVLKRLRILYRELPDAAADTVCLEFGYPFLDDKRLSRLSKKLRVHLLGNSKLRRRLFLPEFEQALRRDPLSHPDTPESIFLKETPKRNRKAVSFIRDGLWKGSEVEELIGSGAVKEYEESIFQIVASRKRRFREKDVYYSEDTHPLGPIYVRKREVEKPASEPPSRKVVDAISEIRPVRLRNALNFLRQGVVVEQGRLLAGLPSRHARELVGSIDKQRFLEIAEETCNGDRKDVAKLLALPADGPGLIRDEFTPSPCTRSEILDLWLEQFESREVFRRIFTETKRDPKWQTCFDFHVRAPDRKAKRRSWFVTLIGTDNPISPVILSALVAHGSDWSTFSGIRETWKDRDFEKLLRQPDPLITQWLTEIQDRLLRGNRVHEIAQFYRMVAEVSPSKLRSIVPTILPLFGFESLLATWESVVVGTETNPRFSFWILNLQDREGEPLWEQFLKECATGPAPPLSKASFRMLETLLRESSKVRFQRLFETWSHTYLVEGLARLPFNIIVRKALDDPRLARRLEARFPREAFRRLIPWARRQWKDQPSIAAAHETALAFSLCDARFLRWLAMKRWRSGKERPGTAFDDLYHTYKLPKKSGGNRLITAPDATLKRLQRRLLENGFNELPVHPAAHGFREGRSIVSNAQEHSGRKMVVHADIQSFFPSTHYPHVLRICRQLRGGSLSEGAVRLVAEICCFDGGLPTGAPTSPAIGNLVLLPVDEALAKAASARAITYTRYADDLSFSGEEEVQRILPFLRKVISDYGYRSDPKKEHIFRRGRRQVVTGLVVNEDANLPRTVRRRLRAAVHRFSQGKEVHWHGKPMSKEQLIGRLAFLNQAHPEEAALHRELLGICEAK